MFINLAYRLVASPGDLGEALELTISDAVAQMTGWNKTPGVYKPIGELTAD